MLDLKLLTRNFHDQLCDKVELTDDLLTVYISAYECGDKYYHDGLRENANPTDTSNEILRNLKIKFYNVKNVNKDFNFDFKDSLDIYELNINDSHIEFRFYFDEGSANFLLFDCSGFDIEYFDKL